MIDLVVLPNHRVPLIHHARPSRRGINWRVYQKIVSLRHYVLISQNSADVEIYTRHNADWLLHTESGLEASLTLPGIDVTIPLADLYENVRFDETAEETG